MYIVLYMAFFITLSAAKPLREKSAFARRAILAAGLIAAAGSAWGVLKGCDFGFYLQMQLIVMAARSFLK